MVLFTGGQGQKIPEGFGVTFPEGGDVNFACQRGVPRLPPQPKNFSPAPLVTFDINYFHDVPVSELNYKAVAGKFFSKW